jgi:branched-chain amino acid transport system ATP-binding protein
VASKGIARTFQLEELFGSMTVLENAMTGCHGKSRSGMFSCGFALPSERREEERIRQESLKSLSLVGLEDKAFEPISRLPLGEQLVSSGLSAPSLTHVMNRLVALRLTRRKG